MKLPLFFIAILLISTSSLAAPVVNGYTISWPDDGWYQVQSTEGASIVEVCAGGRSCEVSPGEYIVINHSTGDRYTGINVLQSANPSDSKSPISVTANTISWPDDGWYQVQNVEGYVEVCGGGRSCQVPPGTYVVINHSVRVRYENIKVEGRGETEDIPTPALMVEVDQFTISWPDDGWYQVQDSENYKTLCEGTQSCVVQPGVYIVINHTTGQRVEDVSVSAPEPDVYVPPNCSEGPYSHRLSMNCFSAEDGFNVSYYFYTKGSVSYLEFEVKSAGDFNGDGYPDMLVPIENSVDSGAIIVLGSAEGWSEDISLTGSIYNQLEATNQDRKVVFSNGYGNAFLVGDINADGYSDIGFSFDQEVRFVFGRANAGGQTLSLASESEDIDLTIDGEMSIYHASVAPAGDFNGDNINDLVLATDIYSTFNEDNRRTYGALFIIYGQVEFEPVISLNALDSTEAKIFLPGALSKRFAYKSTGVGDVDADGFDDVLFSDKETGATYLVYGGEVVDDYKYRLNENSVPNMTRIINSASLPNYVYKGRAVSGGGDFNGDGFADFAIMEENTSESIDIIFGRAELFPSILDVNSADNSAGFTVSYDDDGDYPVWSGVLELMSDVNGDGLADLIIGSETINTHRGAVYIVFGTTDSINRQFGDTSDGGARLVTGVVDNFRFGRSAHSLGDINGDGIGDFSAGLGDGVMLDKTAVILYGAVN